MCSPITNKPRIIMRAFRAIKEPLPVIVVSGQDLLSPTGKRIAPTIAPAIGMGRINPNKIRSKISFKYFMIFK